MNINKAGKKIIHGDCNIYALASLIKKPSSGRGAGIPTPKNYNAESSKIIEPISVEAVTISGLAIFGMTCLVKMKTFFVPLILADLIYS